MKVWTSRDDRATEQAESMQRHAARLKAMARRCREKAARLETFAARELERAQRIEEEEAS